MKIMKVIDLLNKIVNGEDLPDIIITGLEEDKHYYNKDLKDYINQRTGEKLFEDGYGKFLKYFLNNEIEIIEDTPKENKKIPEKIKDKYCSQISKVELAHKINEIIDYLKSKGE